MLRFLQANLNHCKVAQDLLMKFMQEEAIDVAILSDPYRIQDNGCDRLADASTQRAAILVFGKQISVSNVIRDAEFVSAKVGGYQVYSCYATPNPATRDAFGNLLLRLEDSIRLVPRGTPVVVAGDFNARSAAWGDRVTSRRGDELCDLFAALQLVVQNEGSTPTFTRGEGSIVDVTATSGGVSCSSWEVLSDTFNYSDHNYVRFELGNVNTMRRPLRVPATHGWNTAKGIDPAQLEIGLLIAEWLNPAADYIDQDATSIADLYDSHVRTACDIALVRKSAPSSNRKPVYWWSPELTALRGRCVSAKRCKMRLAARLRRLQLDADDPVGVRAAAEAEAAAVNLRICKKALKVAIAVRKKACWDELIQSVESDPFGKPYKLVMQKLSGPPATARMDLDTLKMTVSTLFPACPVSTHGAVLPLEPFDPFSVEELADVVKRFGSRRTAPGPDGVSNAIISAVHKVNPAMLLETFNRCLEEGTVPRRWKEARVVLLRKGNRPEGVPSSYRPLCLLNDVGKMFEALLASRLDAHIASRGGLATNQYGFRKGRSTDDAVCELLRRVVPPVNEGGFCVAVALDIKNAFNSIGWSHLLAALEAWKVPEYLMRLCRSYFSDREAFTETPATDSGALDIPITGGVPQGSVIGPLLWNLAYNSVLTTALPLGASLIGFADDTLLVAHGKTTSEVEAIATSALDTVSAKIAGLGLVIAVEKTQAVFFTSKYKYTLPRLTINDAAVSLSNEMLYLGIVVDRRLSSREHVQRAADKTLGVVTRLSRIMPNLGGPKERKRRLLVAVAHSVLLYGAPTWAHTLEYSVINAGILNGAQRRALLRGICAYCSVSMTAVNVLAAVPPADLLARGRAMAFEMRRSDPGADSTVTRSAIMSAWVRRLRECADGAWTRRLVPDIEAWCKRRHGQLEFHMTQVMSGHGCFGTYLLRIQKETSSSCHHCACLVDDAAHTLLECPSWEAERWAMTATINVQLRADNFAEIVLGNPLHWEAVASFCRTVMKAKEEAERVRQRAAAVLLQA